MRDRWNVRQAQTVMPNQSLKRDRLRERQVARKAARLMESVRAVLAVRPVADPDNVRHTLLLLELPPLERLRRSLTRGRALESKRAANRAKDKLVIPVLEDSLATTRSRIRRGRRG